MAADRKVLDAVLDGRARGVLFDIGHGSISFSSKTARAMLTNGFPPDCISSDVHALCVDGLAFDLITTMSKFLGLGMELKDVVRAATQNPALALRRLDLGTFREGTCGDGSILALERGSFDFLDSEGQLLTSSQRLSCRGVVVDGSWWHGDVGEAGR